VGFEIRCQYPSEILFRRTVGRPVIVSEIEMCDAVVEGVSQNGTSDFKYVVGAEILPQTE
jgi:hypothetical protein